jgi:chaperonin GroES
MDLRPLHDRVMVTRLDEGEQKQGGIIIPDTAKEKPQQALVKAVGNGKLLEWGTSGARRKAATAFYSAVLRLRD